MGSVARVAGLLLQGGVGTVATAALTAAAAVAALAVVTGAWLIGPAGWPERALFAVAAVALLAMTPVAIGIGGLAILAGILVHLARRRLRAGGDRSAATAPDGTAGGG